MIGLSDLGEWGRGVKMVSRLSGGSRNEVHCVRVGDRTAVARRSRRSSESLDWELDLLEHLSRHGFLVPVPIPTTSGDRRIDGLCLFTWIDGVLPTTRDDWAQVVGELRRLHEATAGWPQRPTSASAHDLLAADSGGDIDLARMPAEVVSVCRHAWSALPAENASHVVHGDPGATNLLIVRGRVGLLDWDEARVDHEWFDLAELPIQVLDDNSAPVARRAADAWETANAWHVEHTYAVERLRRLAAR